MRLSYPESRHKGMHSGNQNDRLDSGLSMQKSSVRVRPWIFFLLFYLFFYCFILCPATDCRSRRSRSHGPRRKPKLVKLFHCSRPRLSPRTCWHRFHGLLFPLSSSVFTALSFFLSVRLSFWPSSFILLLSFNTVCWNSIKRFQFSISNFNKSRTENSISIILIETFIKSYLIFPFEFVKENCNVSLPKVSIESISHLTSQ